MGGMIQVIKNGEVVAQKFVANWADYNYIDYVDVDENNLVSRECLEVHGDRVFDLAQDLVDSLR